MRKSIRAYPRSLSTRKARSAYACICATTSSSSGAGQKYSVIPGVYLLW